MTKTLAQELSEALAKIVSFEATVKSITAEKEAGATEIVALKNEVITMQSSLAAVGGQLKAEKEAHTATSVKLVSTESALTEAKETLKNPSAQAAHILALAGHAPIRTMPTAAGGAASTIEEVQAEYDRLNKTDPKAATAFYKAHKELHPKG